MRPRWNTLAAAALSVLAIACGGGARLEPADLVLRGGRIVTVDDRRPEAEALAIRGDRIAAVGDEAEVDLMIGPDTRVVDLHGAVAVPGFIESHAHFLGLGKARMELDLSTAKSWEEIVGMVRAAAAKAPAGAWILGRGWHQEKWTAPPRPNLDGLPTPRRVPQPLLGVRGRPPPTPRPWHARASTTRPRLLPGARSCATARDGPLACSVRPPRDC